MRMNIALAFKNFDQRLQSQVGPGGGLVWFFLSAHAPKFDYDHWSYGDLSLVDMTAFVEDELFGSLP